MKKLLTGILLIFGMISITFGQNVTTTSTNTNLENFKNGLKVKNLAKLRTYVTDFVHNKFEADMSGVNNTQIQTIFTIKENAILENIDNIFYEMEYNTSKSYEDYIKEIKQAIAPFKQLVNDIKGVKANSSVYTLSADEISGTNAKIIEIQNAFVDSMEESMSNILIYTGIQEDGNMNFSVKTNYGSGNIKFTDYKSKINFEENSQEFGAKMYVDFNFTIPGTSEAASGKIYIDFNTIMKDKDMYITINDYTVNLDNAESSIASMLQMGALIKGKTIHVAYPENTQYSSNLMSFQSTNGLVTLKQMLETLKTDSLFTAFKKTDNGYKLMINTDTLQKMYNLTGDDSFDGINDSLVLNEVINYSSDKGIYVTIDTDDAQGEFVFTKDANGMLITGKLVGTGSSLGNAMNLTWSKNLFNFDLNTKEGITASINWENNKLDLQASFFGNTLAITGDYSKTLADLKILYNSSNIGYLKSTFDGKNGNYDMYLNLDILKDMTEYLKSFEFQMTGDVVLGTGNIEIAIPTDFVEADSLTPNM